MALVGDITLRTDKNGKMRHWIKIGDPNQWELLSVYAYKKFYGDVQHGYVVHHKDKDSLNDSIDNLQAVTRGEHRNIHHDDLSSRPKIFREKTGICSDCGAVCRYRKAYRKDVVFCRPCAKRREDASKKTYSISHSKTIPRDMHKVKRFYPGEIWLMYRLIKSGLLSNRAIAKMLKTPHTTVGYYAKKITA